MVSRQDSFAVDESRALIFFVRLMEFWALVSQWSSLLVDTSDSWKVETAVEWRGRSEGAREGH